MYDKILDIKNLLFFILSYLSAFSAPLRLCVNLFSSELADETHPLSFGGEFITNIGFAALFDHFCGDAQIFYL